MKLIDIVCLEHWPLIKVASSVLHHLINLDLTKILKALPFHPSFLQSLFSIPIDTK